MAKKTITFQEFNTERNENGEIISEKSTHRMKLGSEDHYIKVYLQDISYLYTLPLGTDILIYELLKWATYGSHEIVINSARKRILCETLGKKFSTINNRITDLVNKNVLKRLDTGIYIINPYLFGIGKWEDIEDIRKHHIELKISYNKETGQREMNTELIQRLKKRNTEKLQEENNNITEPVNNVSKKAV